MKGATTTSINNDAINGGHNFASINDLRSTLNSRIDEINTHQQELSRERDLVAGAPLTTVQAEKMAQSDYVNGADKLLDQQVQELQAKWDKLSQYKEETMKFGKENGLDKTLWRHAPEIFKGEGLKYYETSIATIENNHKFYNGQETQIQTKREQLQERLQTPDARSEIAKKSEEYLVQDKERLAKLEPLDRKFNELNNEKHSIIELRNALPTRKLQQTMNVQGDAKDAMNILAQSDQLKQQATEIKQSMAVTGGLSRSV